MYYFKYIIVFIVLIVECKYFGQDHLVVNRNAQNQI